MKQLYERCAGMDVHKKTVTVCAVTPEKTETITFLTMTGHLEKMADWLEELGIRHVAMESTGVYWKPLYNLLESRECGFEIVLVNAHHVKHVPGRKTDVKDAEWLAQLMQHGLLTASYVPSREQRELRELVRYRRSLIEEQTREVNRIQKVLEGANIKLGDVATDVLGKSGRAMLTAMVNGEDDSAVLADMARGRLRNKLEQLTEALHGVMGEHQRMILKIQLERIASLESHIEALDQEVAERMRPFDKLIARLDDIPGVGRRTCEEILAEIGIDMSRFPTSRNLASWAGMCPGNNASAGKRKSGKRAPGNPHLRRALIQAAHAAARTRNTYLSALFRRISSRRGAKRAAVAVGHSILVTIYHMINDGSVYDEMGAAYLDSLNEKNTVRKAVKRLESLGYTVSLKHSTEMA